VARARGRWVARGTLVRGPLDSENRRVCLEAHDQARRFDWLNDPVLNPFTRLAVETSPATGELAVLGIEPTSKRMHEVVAATDILETVVTADGFSGQATTDRATAA
jgi:hypothetical protein